MEQDALVKSAVAHWSGRFVANGIPLTDFNDVTASIKSWDEWCRAWSERGAVHEELGRTALKEGRTLSAGEHLTTAGVCYHFGKFLFVHDQQQMRAAHDRAVRCRTDALAHLRPPGERVEIPYDGITLKGNLRKPRDISNPPVVVMIMGLDSAKEEMDSNERVFLDRGLATLTFDGPGQGEGEYDRGICPEYEKPGGAVLDFVESRNDLDASRIGVWGVSFGGYYAPRVAAHDKRVKACISLSGPFDWSEIFDDLPELTRNVFISRSRSSSREEAFEFARRVTMHGCARDLACPIYIIAGRLDRVTSAAQSEKLAASVAGPVVLNMVEDGTHGVNNRPYKYRTQSADWMAAQLRAS